MNHLALLIGSYLAIASQHQNSANPSTQSAEWESYKTQFGKQYESAEVDSMRQVLFSQTKQRIEQFNQSPDAQNFTLGLNHLADLSEMEKMSLNGFKLPSGGIESRPDLLKNSPEAEKFVDEILNDDSIGIPDQLDWRTTSGRVSRVKDQGQCGSCWAFATTGVLEGQMGVRSKQGKLIELSEQNLVDCVKADQGCNGGIMSDALDAVKSEGGIDDESSYPYETKQRQCRYKRNKVAFTDNGYAILPNGDEQKLKAMVAKYGPVAVAIEVLETFQLYKQGVYYDKNCRNGPYNLNHAVLVVGYGTEPNGGDYWIVKNSWNSNWGQNGYIKMARNRKNNCGIATIATIATF